MSRQIRLRVPAVEDLDAHFLFIAQDRLEAAIRLHDAAHAAFQRLVELPEIGAPRSYKDPRLAALRVWPIPGFPNYLIYYHHTDDGIEVVRVLHAKRDVERTL